MHQYCLDNDNLAKHFRSDAFRAATQIQEFGAYFVSRNLPSLFPHNFRSESFVEWKVDMPDPSEGSGENEQTKVSLTIYRFSFFGTLCGRFMSFICFEVITGSLRGSHRSNFGECERASNTSKQKQRTLLEKYEVNECMAYHTLTDVCYLSAYFCLWKAENSASWGSWGVLQECETNQAHVQLSK